MVPRTLIDWTYEVITSLCVAGQSESDQHDFKFNLPDARNLTKLCCAFANTFGGFIVVGVKDAGHRNFQVSGLDPNKELYGNFLARVNAEPDISISPAKTIAVPGSSKLLYIFEVPNSPRRPHLPARADERVFWKRQGSSCVQMTLEEIRYQMNSYEEKRDKLSLLLIDLRHKLRSLNDQASIPDRRYMGDTYSFEIFDRVVVEAYAFLKDDVNTIGALDMIKRRLDNLNGEKQKLLSVLSVVSTSPHTKDAYIDQFREVARKTLPGVTILVEQIERTLNEKFGIVNPYKIS